MILARRGAETPSSPGDMRPYGLLLGLMISLFPGCMAPAPAPRPAPSPDALLGRYELVSISGRPLPVREFQAVYHGGQITLLAGQRYVSGIDAETCTPDGACKREAPVVEGVWRVRPDGTLEFDPHEESNVPEIDRDPLEGDWPPPRIEADGRESRFYTAASEAPYISYRRG